MLPARCTLTAALCLSSLGFAAEGVEEDVSATPRQTVRPELFLGAGVGGGWSIVEHPKMKSGFFAPTLALVAGAKVTPTLSLGLEVQSTAKWVQRKTDGVAGGADVFVAGATCTTCSGGGAGAELQAITATFSSVGPRADFAPWGVNGPYLGAALGVAFIQGLPTAAPVGFAGSAHAGLRYRVMTIVELAVEAGLYGQQYADARVLTPYASASSRLHF